MIATHNGYGDVPAVCIDEYPAVRRYLDTFYDKLEKRCDKGSTPYNLRNCTYHGVFGEEKLFWMHMSPVARFAYSHSESIFCNQKAFVVTGTPVKYLCAILNSRIITWYVTNTAVTTGMGLIQWDKFVVETIPIPKLTATEEEPLLELIDKILSVKDADTSADTSQLETEMDRRIYKLYGLTESEIDGAIASSMSH